MVRNRRLHFAFSWANSSTSASDYRGTAAVLASDMDGNENPLIVPENLLREGL
jgi:hypothetical protein